MPSTECLCYPQNSQVYIWNKNYLSANVSGLPVSLWRCKSDRDGSSGERCCMSVTSGSNVNMTSRSNVVTASRSNVITVFRSTSSRPRGTSVSRDVLSGAKTSKKIAGLTWNLHFMTASVGGSCEEQVLGNFVKDRTLDLLRLFSKRSVIWTLSLLELFSSLLL